MKPLREVPVWVVLFAGALLFSSGLPGMIIAGIAFLAGAAVGAGVVVTHSAHKHSLGRVMAARPRWRGWKVGNDLNSRQELAEAVEAQGAFRSDVVRLRVRAP